MSITTKKGDKGFTDIKGKRVSKSDPLINCLGELDELSSLIICTQAQLNLDKTIWEPIVSDLYKISSYITGYIDTIDLIPVIHVFEDEILSKQNKTFKFIFPFDDKEKAQLHYLRAVARRVERTYVDLFNNDEKYADVIKYINRLSDFIFSKEL